MLCRAYYIYVVCTVFIKINYIYSTILKITTCPLSLQIFLAGINTYEGERNLENNLRLGAGEQNSQRRMVLFFPPKFRQWRWREVLLRVADWSGGVTDTEDCTNSKQFANLCYSLGLLWSKALQLSWHCPINVCKDKVYVKGYIGRLWSLLFTHTV